MCFMISRRWTWDVLWFFNWYRKRNYFVGESAVVSGDGGLDVALLVLNASHLASRGIRLRPSPRRPCRHHLHKYGYGWALVPPASVGYRASLVGLAVGFDIRFVWKFCVGADRCVRPHGNAPLLWMTDAGRMSNSLCRGGLPRPPAVTTCLPCCLLALVVGASRSTSHLASRWQASY